MTYKSRAYYQYMLDKTDGKIGYYSTDDIEQLVYDLLDECDADEAMRACQIGLDQHPGDELLELVEAKVLVHLHKIAEAERIMEGKPEAASPFDVSIRFGIMVSKGKYQEALNYLTEKFMADKLMTIEFVEIIDEMFSYLPKAPTAECLVTVANHVIKNSKQGEQEAEALGRIGAQLMDCNCHEKAIPVLERALDQDAYDVYTWQDLSRCQLELGQYEKCANSCEMGLAIDPNNPLFNFALGYICFSQNEFERCIEHLLIAKDFIEGKIKHEEVRIDRIEAEQQTNFTYEMLGNAYSMLGKNDKAIENYTKLIDRMPKFDEIYLKLATLHMDQGDTPEALKDIDNAIRLKPDKLEYKALRVAMLTDMHQYDEVMKELDELIRLQPQSKTYLLAKAQLSMNLNRYDEADKTYRRLLELKPKDDTSKELLRAYFESIGDNEALKKID